MKYRSLAIVDKTDDNCWTGRKHFWIANEIARGVNCFEDIQCISHEETLRKLHRLGAEAAAFYANEVDAHEK